VTDGGSVLHFPDGPKTALDDMIDQLVEGAGRVRRAQGRLRGLLRATAAVSEDLNIDTVLRNLAESAAYLTDAKHAAVLVHGAHGEPVEVVHTGLDERLLRVVRTGDRALWPDDRLGCSLSLGDTAYGEICVFESGAGGFRREDAELLRALATNAATALSHADLYHQAQRHHEWLRANAQIVRQILDPNGEDPLSVVARTAAELAEADLVTVSLLTGDHSEIVVEAGSGERAEDFVGQRFAVEGTAAAAALADGTPVPIADYRSVGNGSRTISSEFDAGPVMLVPLVGSHRIWGLMSVIRTRGRDVFSPEDLAMVSDFANHATLSLELAEARDTEQRMRLMEDRERIARDLHDHVIQELFAIGLGIESAAGSAGVPEAVRDRLRQRVEDLDRSIRRVRTSVFALRGNLDRTRDELRSTVLDVAAELTPALGFSPAVQFSGAPGSVADDLLDDVTAVVREALSNVARHADADSATVELIATADRLAVVVSDDGVGIEDTGRRSGTANLAARAERRGGICTVARGPVRGTVITWEVGLP
jgi:signal transduction histidine kinase